MQWYILPVLATISHGVLGQGLDANGAGCQVAEFIITSCQRATPSFTALPIASRAACLCYYSGTWAPRMYDNYLGSCYNYAKTADPAAIPSGGVNTTPCQAAGNVRNAPATTDLSTYPDAAVTSVTSVTSVVNDPNAQACAALGTTQVLCQGATAGFATLPFSRQASCYCYSGSAYAPTRYDNAVGACFRYFSTASPADYASLTALGPIVSTPCAAAGDVRATRSSSGPPASSPATPTPVTSSGRTSSQAASSQTTSSQIASSQAASSGGASSQASSSLITSGVVTPTTTGPAPTSRTATVQTAGGPRALSATERTTLQWLCAAMALTASWTLFL